MRINTNMNAMTALNQMGKNTALAGSAMNKISSGERINKAGDDAAGMAISEKMRGQIRGLDQASKNTQDGVSVVQTAEGAMEETGNILQRMRELSVQSANETNSVEDRAKIAEELTQLTEEIDRIANSTEFNGKKLLNGGGTKVKDLAGATKISNVEITNSNISVGDKLKIASGAAGELTATITKADGSTVTQTLKGLTNSKADQVIKFDELGIDITVTGDAANTGSALAAADAALTDTDLVSGNLNSIKIQAGANSGNDTNQTITVDLNQIDSATLGINIATDIDAIKDADLAKGTKASNDLIDKLDVAFEKVNTSRANLGAVQNRLETAQSNLTTSSENLTAAESRIRDVDVAKEMMNLSKLNLLSQASQAMAAQAKQQPEGIMQLLR